jgi:hypothetical protein
MSILVGGVVGCSRMGGSCVFYSIVECVCVRDIRHARYGDYCRIVLWLFALSELNHIIWDGWPWFAGVVGFLQLGSVLNCHPAGCMHRSTDRDIAPTTLVRYYRTNHYLE